MLKIYAIPVSLYCAKLRILLRHKRLKWQEISPPGGYGSEEYKDLVPAGSLPALEHDGMVLSDSEAIAEYLNERFCEPDMLPGEAVQRAKIRERSRFHDTRLEPALRAMFPLIGRPDRDQEMVDQRWSAVETRLSQLQALLPRSENSLTLGDCGFPITFEWTELLAGHFGKDLAMPSSVQSYRSELEGHDAVAAELSDYRPKLLDWLSQR